MPTQAFLIFLDAFIILHVPSMLGACLFSKHGPCHLHFVFPNVCKTCANDPCEIFLGSGLHICMDGQAETSQEL